MRVECNVEIISQLEVGGGGTDWLEKQAKPSLPSSLIISTRYHL